jgi:DNA-binding IclR family transcriptional regulator
MNGGDAGGDKDGAGGGGEKLVGALVAGLRILRHLAAVKQPAGVTHIARQLGLNPSTCYQLLKTLVHEGLLSFDPATKTYNLDLGLLELASGALGQASYARLVHPHLMRIARRHEVNCTLWQRLGERRVVLVDQAEAAGPIGVRLTIGQRLPLAVGALGRCMVAQSGLSKAAARRAYAELRWQVPPGFERYWREVEAAGRDGYAVDADGFVRGITSVSAIVSDRLGAPLLAISAVGLSAQFSAASLAALAADVRAHAADISRAVTGAPAVAVPAASRER